MSKEVSIGGGDSLCEFFKGKVEDVGVNDEDGRIAKWVHFKAKDMCKGFTMCNMGWFIALMRRS